MILSLVQPVGDEDYDGDSRVNLRLLWRISLAQLDHWKIKKAKTRCDAM